MNELIVLLNFEFKRLIKSLAIIISLVIFIFVVPIMVIYLNSLDEVQGNWYAALQIQMIFLIILIPSVVSYVWKGYLHTFERNVILLKLNKKPMYILAKMMAIILLIYIVILIFYIVLFGYFKGMISITLMFITLFQVMSTVLYCVAFNFLIAFFLKRTIYLHIITILYLLLSIQFINSPFLSIWFNPDLLETQLVNLVFNLKRIVFLCLGVFFIVFSVYLFDRRMKEI